MFQMVHFGTLGKKNSANSKIVAISHLMLMESIQQLFFFPVFPDKEDTGDEDEGDDGNLALTGH